jgi:LPXTG-motif cell wall-anchored protein
VSRIESVKSLYLNNTSLSVAQRFTLADACLSSYIDWAIYTKATKESSAWRKGYDIQIAELKSFQNSIRNEASSILNVSTVTKDVRGYNLKWYTGNPFTYEKGSVLTHGVYTPKNNSSNELEMATKMQVIDEQGKTSFVDVPQSGAESSKSFMGIIIGVAAVVIGGIFYLLKKKK